MWTHSNYIRARCLRVEYMNTFSGWRQKKNVPTHWRKPSLLHIMIVLHVRPVIPTSDSENNHTELTSITRIWWVLTGQQHICADIVGHPIIGDWLFDVWAVGQWLLMINCWRIKLEWIHSSESMEWIDSPMIVWKLWLSNWLTRIVL